MTFISIIMLTALSIATAGAYFSIYGLANVFQATFWPVIAMGGSIEVGKLVLTSYLYRYWNATNFLLKSIAIILVIFLMILTSTGIFGFLSAGYSTGTVSLKETEQKVSLLEAEKNRLITRKLQIDNQIASLPADTSRGRITLMKGFKDEQSQVTNRINTLDKEELVLKTNLIQTESHVGPIIYIAKVFGLDTDNATKYLIYLIMVVFDPLAVTLTLCGNIAIREKEKKEEQNSISIEQLSDKSIYNIPPVEVANYLSAEEIIYEPDIIGTDISKSDITEPIIAESYSEPDPIESDIGTIEEQVVTEPIIEPIIEDTVVDTIVPPIRVKRNYAGVNSNLTLDDLIEQYHYYKARVDIGEHLSLDESWAYTAVRDALQTKGFNIYV